MDRREFFLKTASIAGAGVALSGFNPSVDAYQANRLAKSNAHSKLSVLILGGTDFLGPTIVETLLDRGHSVTLFNRGITNPNLFNYLERLRGDREEENGGPDLSALHGREWDVVIDTWQKGPKCVEDTARLLCGHVGAYFYVSTISVYHNTAFRVRGTREDARLSDLEGQPINRKPDEQVYYLRKTLGEKVLQENFDGPVAIFRSHGMRGERKVSTDQEKYWPVRIWRGGKVLAPEDGQTWAQITDVVSLCRFMAHCAEERLSGPFNVMSRPFRLIEYLEAIKEVTGSDAEFIWASRERLAEFDVEPYRDIPMWRLEPEGIYHFSPEKAFNTGFINRPLQATVASILDGYFQRNPNDEFEFGLERKSGTLSAALETKILAELGC